MQFGKATRKKAKLRLLLTGPSGSGKTYSALKIAKGMGGKIALIDTEKGSASLYSNVADFDVLELDPPFSPERFIEAIALAGEHYDILIIDSISHEWEGTGGCLQINEALATSRFKGNTWSAWSETTPRHQAFLDTLLRSPIHIIATSRSKTETVQSDVNGRKTISKLGMKSVQRDGIEYEFTTVLDIVHDGHYAVASKDRTGIFMGKDPAVISEKTAKQLMEWLESGQDVPTAADIIEKSKRDLISGVLATNSLGELQSFWKANQAKIGELPEGYKDEVTNAKDAHKKELQSIEIVAA